MIFLAHESITAIKHLQVILFSQLHLYNSIVREIQPSFTSEEHCRTADFFPEITGIQGHHTNLLHGVWIPCLSLETSKAELHILPVDVHRIHQDNLFLSNPVLRCYTSLCCSFMFIAFSSICSCLMKGLLYKSLTDLTGLVRASWCFEVTKEKMLEKCMVLRGTTMRLHQTLWRRTVYWYFAGMRHLLQQEIKGFIHTSLSWKSMGNKSVTLKDSILF